jgi:hypothetical protein
MTTVPATATPPASPVRRLAAALYRRPRVQIAGLLAAPLGWLVIAYLCSLALFLVSVLVDRHVAHRHDADPGQLPEDRHQRDLSNHRVPDRDHGQRGHVDLHRGRLPDRVLHGTPRVAADAWTADRLGPAPVVVGLPRQGLRLAAHAQPERRHQLGPRALRPGGARLQHRGGVARRELPVAAVHDHPDLRRPGTDPVLDVRGVRRSRRASRDHVPADRPAAGPAGGHRGRHLHLQPDPRRLHHPGSRLEQPVHRQRRLRAAGRVGQPAARRRVRARSRRDHARLPLVSRRLGAFEAL